ncbi:MAG TPA: hypothetical protein VF711_05420, partial [Acidimicrobiales bacterium]
MALITRWRRRSRPVLHWISTWGRRLHLLPYKAEQWTTERWDAAYDAGKLGYYADLGELARYSVIVG